MEEQQEAPPAEVVEEAVEEAVAEATEEQPAVEEKPDFSRQFSAIARRERELRQRESRMKEMEARFSEVEGYQNEYSGIQELASKNPYEAMKKLGIDYDALTQQVINEGEPTADQQLRLENEALRARLDKLEGAYNEEHKQREQAQAQAARNKLIDNVRQFVDDGGDYEFVQANDAYGLVAEVMQQHYIRTKEIMEYSEAAKMVEGHFESEAERYLGSKKLQDKWRATSQKEPEQKATSEAEPAKSSRPKTLSNENTAKKTEPSSGVLESKEKSLERVAQLIRWE
jgi:regulator of replication initiation timing